MTTYKHYIMHLAGAKYATIDYCGPIDWHTYRKYMGRLYCVDHRVYYAVWKEAKAHYDLE